ncbi:MAG: hypothetical protein KAQ72_10460 [Desulfobacula sp.]|nr:hypothetical protein [Desulfobacula sp.]
MKTINRTAITIIPKKLYINWANSFDDAGENYDPELIIGTTILMPDDYDEFNYEKFIKKHYKKLFEEQLESWIRVPDLWPKKRSIKMFKEWFEIIPSDMILDFGYDEIEQEDY